MFAMKIAKKNADVARARANGLWQTNLALKATIEEEDKGVVEDIMEECPEDTKYEYNDHMALAAKSFWNRRGKSFNTIAQGSNQRNINIKARTCYNCGDKNHFVADCSYQKREDNGGHLVPKDRTRPPNHRRIGNKNFANKKMPTRVLLVHEEYISGGEEEESNGEVEGVATIAKATPAPSIPLFDSPNENPINNKHKCLMAKATMVTPSYKKTTPSPTMINDETSLKIKCEVVSLDTFLTNIDGDTKVHVEALLLQLGEANELVGVHEETIEMSTLR